jgi:acetyl-CoA C-acetyltransferase
MTEVYLAGGVRTPIGKTGGILRCFKPEELAAAVLNEILARGGLKPTDVQQVVLGNAVGTGGNLARLSVLQAGWPYEISACTVDAQCGSGLVSVQMAHALVASEEADLVIAGGLESVSMAPDRRFNRRDPRFTAENDFYEQAPFSPSFIGNPDTLAAAEALAEEFGVTREDMDALAVTSHKKAYAAQQSGTLADIIKPLEANGLLITQDECPRSNMNLRLLARMKGLVKEGGRITAGNSCLKHDGAAALLLASERAVRKYALRPLARLHSTVSAGCDPNRFPLGPVYAINSLLHRHSLGLDDISAVEINEAFAVKILSCCQLLSLPLNKVNLLGGALAYGHPYGASGTVILLHLLKALERLRGHWGIASIGAVGGMGTATLMERI